jgi:hypothetical protein
VWSGRVSASLSSGSNSTSGVGEPAIVMSALLYI